MGTSSKSDIESGSDSDSILGGSMSDHEKHEKECQAVLEDPVAENFQAIGEDIYALAIATLVRDYVALATSSTKVNVRIARIFMSGMGVIGLLVAQAYLLHAVYALLCASAVNQIRTDYDQYEEHMYSETFINQNGYHRGKGPEFFDVAQFPSLKESMKTSICEIPLAHPIYAFAILYIWTLTCLADLRTNLMQTQSLIQATPTVELREASDALRLEDEGASVVVVGLPLTLKVILGLFCLGPRFIAISLLNFLGCRWLLATNSLSDLLLNGLALEFMIVLKDLLYSTLASERNKKVTESTQILSHDYGKLTVFTTVSGLAWPVLGAVWVFFYMNYFQQVLPGYMWDVKHACIKYGAYSK